MLNRSQITGSSTGSVAGELQTCISDQHAAHIARRTSAGGTTNSVVSASSDMVGDSLAELEQPSVAALTTAASTGEVTITATKLSAAVSAVVNRMVIGRSRSAVVFSPFVTSAPPLDVLLPAE
jgi:hypothetical protein